ncbi:hypothetical protein [Arenimonas sp.]|jgi:uncharacterized membrane protein|uniref:hypothetical protein n=1 Tax=Arenimonas sp. TaxID=1872635 RepID=UPI0037BE89F7
MNSLRKFIINTLTGGVFFLLPITVVLIILKKIHEVLILILKPVAARLPDDMMGFDGPQTMAVLVLVIICFMSGLLFRSRKLRTFIEKLEDNFLSAIPGYTFVTNMVADKLNYKDDDAFKPVLVPQGESLAFGFLIEESDGLSSVYVPGAPDFKSGSLQIFTSNQVERLDVPPIEVSRSLKRLGRDSLALVARGRKRSQSPAA